MRTSNLSILLLVGAIQCQNIADIAKVIAQPVMPSNLEETLGDAVKPIKDLMEPFKTHETKRERGTPTMHEELGKCHHFFICYILSYRLHQAHRRRPLQA